MPGGRSIKPGDVVTSMSGQTIEILNTDAEGRLILCDALTYAERLKPAVVVDVATLTGACVIALGHHHTGLFARTTASPTSCWRRAGAALDPCWRMPLDEEYGEALKSNFADMGNVGGRAGRRDHRGDVPAAASPASIPGPISTSPAPPGSRGRPRERPAGRSAC